MIEEKELLRAAAAVRLGFATPSQIREAAVEASAGEKGSLTDALLSRGLLTTAALECVDAFIRARTGDTGNAHGMLLASLTSPGDLSAMFKGLPEEPRIRETLLEWKGAALAPRDASPGLKTAFRDGGATLKEGVPGPADAPVELRSGNWDRYEIKGELGRGGLGKVLDAMDRDFGREVAVKTMLPGQPPSAVERFLQESRAAGRLPHPNIIPIYEMGFIGDPARRAPYFTMAKIRGRDLGRILQAVERGGWEGREEKTDSRFEIRDSRGSQSPAANRSPLPAGSDPRQQFNRPRLLGIFLDVCNAVAYAHDHGVIHRDLKPANVMVGDYGEVYVVDWGLAKIIGENGQRSAVSGETESVKRGPGSGEKETDSRFEIRDSSSNQPLAAHRLPLTASDTPLLTLEGTVMGTPAYMPPEQAAGRISEIDQRSDIYSLGAILFQILTFRPPFEGSSAQNVLMKVISEETTPPSRRVSEMLSAMEGPVMRETPQPGHAPSAQGGEAPSAAAAFTPDPVPEELDRICLKALSKDKRLRFSTAKELANCIQDFLEGEKERERNHAAALERVQAGREHASLWKALVAEKAANWAAIKEGFVKLKPFWPIERKQAYIDIYRRSKEILDETAREFGAAQAAFQEALGFEKGNQEARAGLADLFWEQFLLMEQEDNRGQMVYCEGLVRQYNDGQYDERLGGKGILSVRTSSYPCRCMREGRIVDPGEFDPDSTGNPAASFAMRLCSHPMSGRAYDGHEGGQGMPELEPREPMTLKVHSRSCSTAALDGVSAWLFRYETRDYRMFPAFPAGVEASGSACAVIPPQVADSCFAKDSPYRPSEGLFLGKTPLAGIRIPMGSYLLILSRDGFRSVRYSLHVTRLLNADLEIVMYGERDVPAGFVQVPAGSFIFQGDKGALYTAERQVLDMPDFFISERHFTCADYLGFLNALSAANPAEAEARTPRKAQKGGEYWPRDSDGRFIIPTEEWIAASNPNLRDRAQKLDKCSFWWRTDWPALGVSWQDAMAFIARKTRETGYLLSLPNDLQWEKAARGTDGRPYSWGLDFDSTFCNTSQSHDGPMRPVPVNSYPSDESPYGAVDFLGNARDFMLNDPGSRHPGWCTTRGGYWSTSGMLVRITPRTGLVKTAPDPDTSFRTVLYPSISSIRLDPEYSKSLAK